MSNLERLKNRIAAEGLDAVLLIDSYNRHFATGFHSTAGTMVVYQKNNPGPAVKHILELL